MNTSYKFPYYGAGEVLYHCDSPFFLHVYLKQNLSEKQQELIIKAAPGAGEVVFLDKQIDLFDDVNIHAAVSKAYRTPDGIYLQDDQDWQYFECSNSQIQAFNSDIERWLNEIHSISAIFFAFNDIGYEEGYSHKVVRYSDWHQWSLKQYRTIVPFFETEIANGYNYYDFQDKAHIIQKILTQVEEIQPLEDQYIHFLYPGKLEFEAFATGDIAPLKNITNTSYAEKAIKFFTKQIKKEQSEFLNQYAEVFLSFETKVKEHTFEELITILFTHYEEIDSLIFKEIANHLTNVKVANRLAERGYELITNREYEAAVTLFTKLLFAAAEPAVESGFYTNLLWVLQNDNTGIPINKKLNEMALKKSLPKGEEYPAIFFNSSCLYVEMKDYKQAYRMIEMALANYFDAKVMLEQIANEPLCKQFREKTAVINLLENHKTEPKINPEPRLVSRSVAFDLFDFSRIKNKFGAYSNFSTIIHFNGHVVTEGEFNLKYRYLLPFTKNSKELNSETLVLVNGNLKAKSIGQYSNEYLVVKGEITCDDITLKEFTKVGETNFEYVAHKLKRHYEE